MQFDQVRTRDDARALTLQPGWRRVSTADEPGETWRKKVFHDVTTGEVMAELVMFDGATAPLHTHRDVPGGEYSEETVIQAGEIHGLDPSRHGYVARAGDTVTLEGPALHAPYVAADGFVVLRYHNGGSEVVKP